MKRILPEENMSWQRPILSITNEGTATKGNRYIVGDTPTGTFTGLTTDNIAWYDGTEWQEDIPEEGWITYDLDQQIYIYYINGPSGFEWTELSTGIGADGVLNKYDATEAPTANDDSGDGYSVGSIWIDITNDLIYQCADATLTAAVWKCLSSVIIDDAPSDGETYGRKDGTWAMVLGGDMLYNLLMSPSFNTLEPINLTIDIDSKLTMTPSWS